MTFCQWLLTWPIPFIYFSHDSLFPLWVIPLSYAFTHEFLWLWWLYVSPLSLTSDDSLRVISLIVSIYGLCVDSLLSQMDWHPSMVGSTWPRVAVIIRFRLALCGFRALPSYIAAHCTSTLPSCCLPLPGLWRAVLSLLSLLSWYGVCFIVSAYMVSCTPWWTHLIYKLVTLSADAPVLWLCLSL